MLFSFCVEYSKAQKSDFFVYIKVLYSCCCCIYVVPSNYFASSLFLQLYCNRLLFPEFCGHSICYVVSSKFYLSWHNLCYIFSGQYAVECLPFQFLDSLYEMFFNVSLGRFFCVMAPFMCLFFFAGFFSSCHCTIYVISLQLI